MTVDADRLRQELNRLRGAELFDVVLASGEIFVEFRKFDGVWSLGTGGSTWALRHRGETIVTDDDEDPRSRFVVARGTEVEGCELRQDGLRVDLSHELAFVIKRSDDGVAADLPIFELATPEKRTLFVFDDGIDEVDDDIPIPELLRSGALHRWPSG